MRIAQIITSLSTGGAENLVAESSLKFEEKGIEVDVITLRDNETPFYFKLKKTFKGNVIGLTKGSVYNPLLIFKLIPILKQYKIVHVHLFPTLYWVVLAKWISFSKVKIIYTEHSTNNKRRENKLFNIIEKFIYNKLEIIITISNEVDKSLKNHLGNNLKSCVINNGINLESIQKAIPISRESFGYTTQDQLMIQVSSFRYPKDQKTLICALHKLPTEYKLILVGEGPNKVELEKYVAENKLNHRVNFLGLRNDVSALLKMSDIAFLSSYYEGLSLSSIEAMASGIPFIASDSPGLREIVANHGILFKTANVDDLIVKILSLQDPIFKSDVILKCMNKSHEFDLNTMVDKYINVYKKVLNEN